MSVITAIVFGITRLYALCVHKLRLKFLSVPQSRTGNPHRHFLLFEAVPQDSITCRPWPASDLTIMHVIDPTAQVS